MDLTAHDVEVKQFHDAWRGYDQREVDDFLDAVAETLEKMQRENVAVRRRVNELEQAVAASRDTEEMLKKTLVTAQQAAEEAIAKAKAKAEQLVAEAQERSARATDEARSRAAAAEEEARARTAEIERRHASRKQELDIAIEKLSSFEAELNTRLRSFLEQQLTQLDQLTQPPPGRPTTQPARSHERPRRPEREGRPEVRVDPDRDTGPIRVTDEAPEQGRRGVRSFFGRDEA